MSQFHTVWLWAILLNMAEFETMLYGNQFQMLFSFLEGTPQLRQLLKELLPLGFRELVKAACLQGNSASLCVTVKCLPQNSDQATPTSPTSFVSANGGHSSSTGPKNVDVEQNREQPRRRRSGSCSCGARPYAPAAEVWRRRQNPKIRGGGTLEGIVAELGAANLDSATHDPREWAKVIATSSAGYISNQGSQASDDSFGQILEQCMVHGWSDVALSFQTMIAQIKLAIKIQW